MRGVVKKNYSNITNANNTIPLDNIYILQQNHSGCDPTSFHDWRMILFKEYNGNFTLCNTVYCIKIFQSMAPLYLIFTAVFLLT